MMLEKGNGSSAVCVLNLLRTWRGEVPYERLKGVDTSLIDRPAGVARPAMEADAVWVVNTYEPRVTANDAVTAALDGMQGDFELTMNVQEN